MGASSLSTIGSSRPNGYTRLVTGFLFTFVVLTGVLLFVFSTDTGDRFAWTIKVPITAAFIGACFLSTTPGLVGVFLVRTWSEARLMLVLGLVLITLIAIVTLRHLDEFHLNSGRTFARVIAWIWVVAYFQAPFTLLTAILIEERGRRHEPSGRPLTLWFRGLLVAYALALCTLGFGLILATGTLDVARPWRLTSLAGGVVGTWLAGIGVGCGWMAVENSWERARLATMSLAVFPVLLLVGAGRFWDNFTGGATKWAYLAIVCGSFAAFVGTIWTHDARPGGRFRVETTRRFCRHDEVVAVEAFDLVRPPRHRRPAPFREQRGVMSLFLRKLTDLVREFQRLPEIVESEDAPQPIDCVAVNDLPLGDLRM